MATFQFAEHRYIKLNFCGKVEQRLEFNSELQRRCKAAGELLVRKSEELDRNGKGGNLDELCDCVMDAIDDILGEGMADRILGMKENYSLFDAMDVFKYITDEISNATRTVVTQYGRESVTIRESTDASDNPLAYRHDLILPAPPKPNRAERRAAARAGR